MTAQNPAPTATPIAVPHTSPSTLKRGGVWKDGVNFVSITNVDNDLIEYGYSHRRDVYYMTVVNFRRQFSAIPAGYIFTKKEKDFFLEELKKCLIEVKAKNLGDQVYFLMDELGI